WGCREVGFRSVCCWTPGGSMRDVLEPVARGMTLRRVGCYSSLGLYAISFFLPTFEIVVQGNPYVHFGYEAFGTVVLPLRFPGFFGFEIVALWFANPLYWCSLILRGLNKPRSAAWSCTSAVVLAFLFFGKPNILIGYYLWLASIMVFASTTL